MLFQIQLVNSGTIIAHFTETSNCLMNGVTYAKHINN